MVVDRIPEMTIEDESCEGFDEFLVERENCAEYFV